MCETNAVGEKTAMEIIWRGVKGRCPKCGEGRILSGYITQNKSCSECGEDLSWIRADDAPAWLTILVTGHVSVPLIHYFGTHEVFSPMLDTSIAVAAAMVFAGVFLPWAKGGFIAELWRQAKMKNVES